MDTLETKRLEMFVRVCEFGTQFAASFPADSYGSDLFEKLGKVVEDLTTHAFHQSKGRSSVRESSASKAAGRDELYRRLDAISRTARVMTYTIPGLENKFRMPRGLGDSALLVLARSFASDAEPLKGEFIKRGMSANFIEELIELADDFDATIRQKVKHRGKQVAATAAIDEVVERGVRTVRELDVLVRNLLGDDGSALAAWASASHVERTTRKTKGKSGGSPEAPPTQH